MNKKEQVIKIAMKLFIKNWVQSTPMSLISKESKVWMRTIYKDFQNKDVLINEIYLFIKKDQLINIPSLLEDLDTEKSFLFYYEFFIDYWVHNPVYFTFMDQFINSSIITEETKRQWYELYINFIKVLEKWQTNWKIKSISINEITAFITWSLTWFLR